MVIASIWKIIFVHMILKRQKPSESPLYGNLKGPAHITCFWSSAVCGLSSSSFPRHPYSFSLANASALSRYLPHPRGQFCLTSPQIPLHNESLSKGPCCNSQSQPSHPSKVQHTADSVAGFRAYWSQELQGVPELSLPFLCKRRRPALDALSLLPRTWAVRPTFFNLTRFRWLHVALRGLGGSGFVYFGAGVRWVGVVRKIHWGWESLSRGRVGAGGRVPGLTWRRRWPDSGERREDQKIRQVGSLSFSTLSSPLKTGSVT